MYDKHRCYTLNTRLRTRDDPEVMARLEWHRFSAEHKSQILKAADESAPGDLEASSRRERVPIRAQWRCKASPT